MARLRRSAVVPIMVIAALAAGCTSPPPAAKPPDPLRPLLNAAMADAATAAAAAAAFADNSATLGVIAAVRRQQATALRTEVDRAAAVTAPPTTTAAPTTTTAPTDEASVTATLLADLTTGQQEAARLLPTLPRYRAGLVGSVAAGCASLAEAMTGTPITDSTPPADPTVAKTPLPADAVTALQQALSAEHAALWLYGTASAFVTGSDETEIIAAMGDVQNLRDATEHRIAAGGATPVPAQPAYLVPQPVTGQSSALAALAVAESDATVAWRSVLEHTDDPALRAQALGALIDSAVRETRWRRLAGESPASIALPGSAS